MSAASKVETNVSAETGTKKKVSIWNYNVLGNRYRTIDYTRD